MAVAVVRNETLICRDVGVEFGHSLGELAARPHLLIQIFELPSDILDDLQRAEDVSVPEIPVVPVTSRRRQISGLMASSRMRS